MNVRFVCGIPYNLQKSLPDPEIDEAQKEMNLYLPLRASSDFCLGNAVSPVFEAAYPNVDVFTRLAMVSEGMMSSAPTQFGQKDTLWIQYKVVGQPQWKTGTVLTASQMLEYESSMALIKTSVEASRGDRVQVRYLVKAEPGKGMASKSFIINSVYLEPSLPCSYPQNIALNDSLTTHRILAFDWEDANNPSARVIYRYRESGQDDWSEFRSAEREEGLSLTPLSSNTLYELSLQSVCPGGDSSLVRVVEGKTLYGLPFQQAFTDRETLPEGFMNFNTTLPSEGSAQIPEENYVYGGFELGVVSGEEHTALGVKASQDNYWLLFPALSMEDQMAPASLKFKAMAYWKQEQELVAVPRTEQAYLLLLASDDRSFNVSDVVDTLYFKDFDPEGRTYRFDLSDRNRQQYFALLAKNGEVDYALDESIYFVLDSIDVSYDGDVPCMPVEDIRQYALTTQSVTLSWTGFSLEYGIAYTNMDTEEQDTVYTTRTEYVLDGLEPGTLYVYNIIGYCQDGHRSPSLPSEEGFFTTGDLCAVPSGFQIARTTWQSVTLVAESKAPKLVHIWASDEERYPNIDYYLDGWSAEVDTFTVSGLYQELNISYNVAVRSVCSAGDSSEWTGMLVFETDVPECGQPTDLESAVSENSADLSWTPGKNNSYFWLMYKEKSENAFDTLDVYKTRYSLYDLESNTTYVWQVQGICDDVFASRIATAEFTTEGVSNETLARDGFRVRAEKGRILVGNPSGRLIERIEVYGTGGRMLYASDFREIGNILLPELNRVQGLVLVRILSGGESVTHKVILM